MKTIRFLPFLLLAALPVAAASQKLTVDYAASSVTFATRATGHTVHGILPKWSLDLTVPDGSDVPDMVVFSANVSDMTTDHKKRDAEMMHWIEPDAHPSLKFELTTISKTGDGYEAAGNLSLHGVTLPITMPVQIEREGGQLTVIGEATIDHQLWGLKQIKKFGLLTVAPEVAITFTVSGTLE
jgi:polyisoprenoid-binding protein YceI